MIARCYRSCLPCTQQEVPCSVTCRTGILSSRCTPGQECTGVCQEAAAVRMQAVALLTSMCPLADLTRLME